MSEKQMLALAALEGMDIDGIESSSFPAGRFSGKLDLSADIINDKTVIVFSIKNIEAVKMANDDDTPPAADAEFRSLLFVLTDEGAQSSAYKKMRPVFRRLGEFLGKKEIPHIIEECKGVSVQFITKTRADKDDPEITFTDLKTLYIDA